MFKKNVYRGERGLSSVRAHKNYATDPGDLGCGEYFSSSIHYARAYGEARKHKVKLKNPVYLSVDDVYRFGKVFDTIHGTPESRYNAARAMTEYFQERGHDGLVVKGYEFGPEVLTIVVFALNFR